MPRHAIACWGHESIRQLLLSIALLTIHATYVIAEPLYPEQQKDSIQPIDWFALLLEKLPPLKNNRGEFWPLVTWNTVAKDSLNDAQIQALLARGVVPHVSLLPAMIPMALQLQKNAAPVIVMQGSGGNWPYRLAGPRDKWALNFPDRENIPAAWHDQPLIVELTGWAIAANRLRQSLAAFKEQGVRIDAAWLDHEGIPLSTPYAPTHASIQADSHFPNGVLKNPIRFHFYTRQLWMQLTSAYFAAPYREYYPRIMVTNWLATLSTLRNPLQSWENIPHPPHGPFLFTASNPIAYGIDIYYKTGWNKEETPDRQSIDRFYRHLLLRQVSKDGYNRSRMAPYLGATVWVARSVAESPGRTPMMSRQAYREILRHLWLRDIDAMQVFNPVQPGYQHLAIAEIMDAAMVYDEMLEIRQIMTEKAKALNFRFPGPTDKSSIWSGLRHQNIAIVRMTSQNGSMDRVTISPWKDSHISLNASPEGIYYRLQRQAGDNTILSERFTINR